MAQVTMDSKEYIAFFQAQRDAEVMVRDLKNAIEVTKMTQEKDDRDDVRVTFKLPKTVQELLWESVAEQLNADDATMDYLVGKNKQYFVLDNQYFTSYDWNHDDVDISKHQLTKAAWGRAVVRLAEKKALEPTVIEESIEVPEEEM